MRPQQWMGEFISERVRALLKPRLKKAGGTIAADALVSLINDIAYPIQDLNTTFQVATVNYMSAIAVDSSRVVAVWTYTDATNYIGYAAVLSIDGTDITVGTPVIYRASSTSQVVCPSVALVDTDKAVVAYSDAATGSYGKAVVLTINGAAITVGTPLTFASSATSLISIVKLDTNKALVAYCDSGNSSYGTAVVLSISGTAVTKGTALVFASASVGNGVCVARLDTTRVVVGYSTNMSAVVLSINGTTITKGTAFMVDDTTGTVSNTMTACFIDTDKVLLAWNIMLTGPVVYRGRIAVLSVAETTITKGTTLTFDEITSNSLALDRLSNTKAIMVRGYSGGGAAHLVSVDGTTVTLGLPRFFKTTTVNTVTIAIFDTNKMVLLFKNANLGSACVVDFDGTDIETHNTSVATGIALTASAYINGVLSVGYQSF